MQFSHYYFTYASLVYAKRLYRASLHGKISHETPYAMRFQTMILIAEMLKGVQMNSKRMLIILLTMKFSYFFFFFLLLNLSHCLCFDCMGVMVLFPLLDFPFRVLIYGEVLVRPLLLPFHFVTLFVEWIQCSIKKLKKKKKIIFN